MPFVLNEAQRNLDTRWTGRDLIPKARRMGVTTYVLARYTAACMMYHNRNAVIISHESESTQRLLQTVRFFIENLRGPSPSVGTLSKNRITFKKTNSTFYIGTAGSSAFGRGDTIHYLHCSEFAYWPDAENLFAGLAQAVSPTGEIAIESTGNGVDGYARRCLRAFDQEQKGIIPIGRSYRCHFLNWLTEEDHNVPLAPEQEKELLDNLDVDLEEPALVQTLTPSQLAFRRNKIIEDFDYDVSKFKQEYPLTLDECFQASGNSVFWKINYVPTPDWHTVDRYSAGLKGHPKQGATYLLGADVAGGTGGHDTDNSVLEVFSIDSNEQVFEWATNSVPPDRLAIYIRDIANLFNEAFVVVEINNHGILTMAELLEIYDFSRLYYNRSSLAKDEIPQITQMGFKTTSASKPLAVGRFRKEVAGDLVIHSPELKMEMSSFVEDTKTGEMRASEGSHDDRVLAASIAMMGWNDAVLFAGPSRSELQYETPFTVNSILAELKDRHKTYPFPEQHAIH